MAFKFRLEKVARYRQKLVDEQGRRVAEANRVVTSLQVRIDAVNEDIARHLSEFSGVNDAVISVQGMMARTMWGNSSGENAGRFCLRIAGRQRRVGPSAQGSERRLAGPRSPQQAP